MVEGEPIFLPSGARVDVVTKSDGTRVYAFRNTAVLTEVDLYALMREVMSRVDEATGAAGFKLILPAEATVVIREVAACRRCGRVGHVAQADSIDPDQPSGKNCRIAMGQQRGELSPPRRLAEPSPDAADGPAGRKT